MVDCKHSKHPKYINSLDAVKGLSARERAELAPVAEKYSFRSNEYYLSLIDWNDPDDPIRQLIVPQAHELEPWGHLDPSGEKNYTVIPGLEHKYSSTALLLASNVCGGICRYCFRKRVFISTHGEILTNLPAAIQYIKEHTEITNVLITGGDPLVLPTNRLRKIIEALMPIEHIQIIRIGTKMLAFNPYRVLNNPDLLKLITETIDRGKQIYVMAHFNHPRELTDVSVKAVKLLRNTGAELTNQTPLIRGVNDDATVLASLFRELSFIGVPPYYIFQCRPASGNKYYAVPVEEGYKIFEQAKAQVSGLAKRARFVMSHLTGKIEVIGMAQQNIYFKYHRAEDDEQSSKFMIFERNPKAYWFDDYEAAVQSHPLEFNYQSYGPE
jgi:lysine 2,3-aminomutase